MYSSSTMNKQHGLILVEGVEGKIFAALQYFWRLE